MLAIVESQASIFPPSCLLFSGGKEEVERRDFAVHGGSSYCLFIGFVLLCVVLI